MLRAEAGLLQHPVGDRDFRVLLTICIGCVSIGHISIILIPLVVIKLLVPLVLIAVHNQLEEQGLGDGGEKLEKMQALTGVQRIPGHHNVPAARMEEQFLRIQEVSTMKRTTGDLQGLLLGVEAILKIHRHSQILLFDSQID